MDIIEILKSPLVQSGNTGSFLRLVLAEAGNHGMPGQTIALLDDVASMLGFYDPIPPGQAAHLAGPLINWRSHPNQPSFERINDVERLVFKQRALIAFGGGKPGQMVGTSEIVCAMGNIIAGASPAEYYDLFTWASLDVLSIITGDTPEQILRDPGKKHWKLIPDHEVLRPGGRLYPTYQEVATSIRREAIANLAKSPDNPREYLRPVAAHFIESHRKVRAEAQAEGMTDVVKRLDDAMATIQGMFPNLGSIAQELPRDDVERET